MLIRVSPTVRIESGPRRKRAVATEELLSDNVTASHYKASRAATKEELAMSDNERTRKGITLREGRRVFIDAMGKPIELGQELDYIDWKASEDEHVFTVYQEQLRPKNPAEPDGEKTPRFWPVAGPFLTQAEAEEAAWALSE